MELCSRYVDPFLGGIFDEPDEGVFLRWTNETTLEAKKQQSLLSWQPDICITRLRGVKWKAHIGFGEAKPAKSRLKPLHGLSGSSTRRSFL
ncbi:uncharacterized protein BYT42DRAFT_157492 [Radiomyces spectabilis]|uniref:uncharacterized protein n=1 Tax=Radiomyces spectabilis TaxID=64574 RepID=UPI00221F2FD7|nr:uncharacterized protein BYT42DRAFT_157492 [Radiomyces spectabilis]KAI8365239.1 hypothetical protein BYT42DRAFT_157492 [Radiomyces spectabilis]